MCVYLSAATGDFACSRTSNRLDRLSDFLRLAVVVVIIVVINVFHLNTKKSCAAGLSGLSIHADTHSLPLSLPFSLPLSMVVIYLIACKKPTHTHITITRKKIQIPSTAQARNQQESYRCVRVHTHNI